MKLRHTFILTIASLMSVAACAGGDDVGSASENATEIETCSAEQLQVIDACTPCEDPALVRDLSGNLRRAAHVVGGRRQRRPLDRVWLRRPQLRERRCRAGASRSDRWRAHRRDQHRLRGLVRSRRTTPVAGGQLRDRAKRVQRRLPRRRDPEAAAAAATASSPRHTAATGCPRFSKAASPATSKARFATRTATASTCPTARPRPARVMASPAAATAACTSRPRRRT